MAGSSRSSEEASRPRLKPDEGAVAGAVEIVEARKFFQRRDHRVDVLDGITLTVSPGEFVSLLGPSGCGKSTLLRLVAGLTDVSSGAISVHGEIVEKPPRSLAMVFQEDTLFEWRTVLENVLLPAEIKKLPKGPIRQRALELLDQVGLKEFTDARPSELSGGMKQRAALCQSLVHNPRVLLMDEPFGALDALTREQMQADLQALLAREKSTVLFVTHSISEAVLLSDRVLVLSRRPARILADLKVALPRPRTEATTTDPQFLQFASAIHKLFRKEGILH